MKIILTGSTGFIGSEVLRQSLARPDITSIIVLSRRSLAPSPETNDPKLKVLVMNDFGTYSESDLKELGDADCCVWYVILYLQPKSIFIHSSHLSSPACRLRLLPFILSLPGNVLLTNN
jgi:hypothetical protein